MKIEMRPTSRIRPYETNPRKNDAAVDAVARSIQEFGFRQPIVLDEDGVIIIGHTRWKAAMKLALDKVPVHVAKGMSPEQARALRIADNRTNEIAEWDKDLLPPEIQALVDAEYDVSGLGFSEDEINALLAPSGNDGLTDPDDVPEPPAKAKTKPGDIYILGNHRLMCGDSSKAEDLDRLLAGSPIHLCNTDPPYNVKVEPRSNNAIAAGNSSFKKAGKKRTHHQNMDLARHPGKSKPTHKQMRAKDRPLENDFMSDAAFEEILDKWFGQIARVLKPGRAFYIWGGYANTANYPPALKKNGLYFSQSIIWDKQHPVLTRKDFMGAHEWCFYGWREGAAHQFFGPNNATDLWQVKKVNPQSMIHLTEKPVELAARAIEYSSRPGENVLELFGGSGSTMIGCEQTGRRCFAMEIDPPYCDVIVERFEKFTGMRAEREGGSPTKKTRRGGSKGRKRKAG